jgi:hypothetical protein
MMNNKILVVILAIAVAVVIGYQLFGRNDSDDGIKTRRREFVDSEGNARPRPSDMLMGGSGNRGDRDEAETMIATPPLQLVTGILETENRRPESTFEVTQYDHSGELRESPPREERRQGTVSEQWAHLISTVSAEDVARAYMDIESDDAEISADAMRILARDREKANEELFLLYLCDESVPPQTRANAAYGLGEIGALNAAPYLVWAMQSEHLTIRRSAYTALRGLTPVEIIFDPSGPESSRQARIDQLLEWHPDWALDQP